jgi:hypothetical protein
MQQKPTTATQRLMSIFLKKIALYGPLSVLAGLRVSAVDITIADPHGDLILGGADNQAPSAIENGRVENNAQGANQGWDLESFNLTGSIASGHVTSALLSTTGGFDYKNGLTQGLSHYTMGDIFIYLGRVPYTLTDPLNHTAANVNGDPLNTWTYAIRFSRDANGNYNVNGLNQVAYEIVDHTGSPVTVGTQDPNPLNFGIPFKETGGGAVKWSGNATYSSFSDVEGLHYTIGGIDVTTIADNLLTSGQFADLHTTYNCGNDVLWGGAKVTTTFFIPTADGGMTLLMLGAGLTGLGLLRRRLT